MILKVTKVCKFTNADERWNREVEVDRAPVAKENDGDPAPLRTGNDVEMPAGNTCRVRVCGHVEWMLLLTTKNVLVCDSELKANEASSTTCKMFWNPRPRPNVRLEPRRGQKRESTQPIPDLEEEVTSTVLCSY